MEGVLEEAERLDMNLWIYDENSYPSGFAGGWVPEQMPESRGRGLRWEEVVEPGELSPDVLGVYRLTAEGYEDVTPAARRGDALSPSRYLVVRVVRRRMPIGPPIGVTSTCSIRE